MKPDKKIYFASDFHLGVPDYATSLQREKRIVAWLESIRHDAEEIFLVGDVFDMWFEYKRAVPRGFVRLLGKLAALSDSGIPVYFFTGNHDMWCFDYLPREVGVILQKAPIIKTYNGKKFFIGHGDGLGPGDLKYKFIKKVFANKVCQWMFARFHPNFGLGIANYWSRKSRASASTEANRFLGEDKEFLVQFCQAMLQEEQVDYFIFGHRHLALDHPLKHPSRYINLGDWIRFNTYGVFDGEKMELKISKGNPATDPLCFPDGMTDDQPSGTNP